MELGEALRVLVALKDDHPYPAMVIDRILLDVQRLHGHHAVNQLIDGADLVRRFGIRKVWPDQPQQVQAVHKSSPQQPAQQ